jgi:predicted transcriptional regulator
MSPTGRGGYGWLCRLMHCGHRLEFDSSRHTAAYYARRRHTVIRMPDELASIPISLRVPTNVLEKLDKIAAAIDRPRTWVCLRALRLYLADEGAEILDVQEGVAQLDRGESVPFEDVMEELEEVLAKAEAKRTAS